MRVAGRVFRGECEMRKRVVRVALVQEEQAEIVVGAGLLPADVRALRELGSQSLPQSQGAAPDRLCLSGPVHLI